MRVGRIVVAVLVSLALAASVQGQSPMINYQGKLLDTEGQPLNETVSISFSIYGRETAGSALWTETQSSVIVENGIFNVLLGSINPIPESLFNGADRWLGLKVGSDSEMSPRQQIVSVGYALRAGNANEANYAADADKLDGKDSSGFADAAHNHGPEYVNTGEANSISSEMIVDGAIQQGDLSFDVPDGHSLDAADGSPIDAVYVDNAGNVGIGTTSPSFPLHVEGRLSCTNAYIEGLNFAAGGWQPYGISCVGTSTLGFWGDGGELNLITDGNLETDEDLIVHGNVGIGTTSLEARLNIQSPSNVNALRVVAPWHPLDDVTFIGSGYTGSDKNLLHVKSGTGYANSRFVVRADGNVGIGTTNPSSKLHIDKSTSGNGEDLLKITSSNKIGSLLIDNTSAVGGQIRVGVGSNFGYVAADVPFRIYTNDHSCPN